MKLITVGTGSAGNCYLLKRDNDRFIALDCGMQWKKVMVASGFRPTAIDLALVTHSHGDHNGYVGDFRRNGIEVRDPTNLDARKVVNIKGIQVIPFEVPHDVPCFAYIIRVDGRNIVYMTDFGYCKYTLKSWNIDTWIIACNHIVPDENPQKRDHVIMGHSSLQTVKEILAVNKCDALRNVVLVHYNGEADTDLMRSEIQDVVGDGVQVTVAKKGATINL